MKNTKMLLAVGFLLCGINATTQNSLVDNSEEKSLVCKGGPGQTLVIEKDFYNKTAMIDFYSFRVHYQFKATYMTNAANMESVFEVVSTHEPAVVIVNKTFIPKVCRAIECGEYKQITALYKSGTYEAQYTCH